MKLNQYKQLIDLLQQFKPKRICQLGSGQSSKIFQHYCQKYGSKVYSIQHDQKYLTDKTLFFPLLEHTTLVIKNKTYQYCNRYEGFEEWLEKQEPFDFIFIDGPPGWGFRMNYLFSRIQIIDFVLLDKIANKSIVLYHDSHRWNAKKTLTQFEKEIQANNFNYIKEQGKQIPLLTVYKLEKLQEK